MSQSSTAPQRVVFEYLVPVHVEVEDGLVVRVIVIDETPAVSYTHLTLPTKA